MGRKIYKMEGMGFIAFVAIGLSVSALAADPPCKPPLKASYQIKRQIQRSTTAFTEGLIFRKGKLLESAGGFEPGSSVLNRIDPETGQVCRLAETPARAFGEGLAQIGGRIFQLTYLDKRVFTWDVDRDLDVMLKDNHKAPLKEGWGLTARGSTLIASDGSANLTYIDPASMEAKKTVTVRDHTGKTYDGLNELELARGSIYANVLRKDEATQKYVSEKVLKIDPATGCVEAELDLSKLREQLPPAEAEAFKGSEQYVLNGLAFDPATQSFFVTGKNWSRIFQLSVTP